VDIRILFLLLFGALVAWYSWHAQVGGTFPFKIAHFRREEYPRLFRIALVMHWALVALCVIAATAVAFGLLPLNADR
jgi:hypothetical protein